MGIRTGRPRGAPIGNKNRLTHGRYSARRIARRKEKNVLLRGMRNLTRRIEMMAWSRKALRRKIARTAPANPVIPGERTTRRVEREGREANLYDACPGKLGSLPSARARPRRE